jgi:hypothetical protein
MAVTRLYRCDLCSFGGDRKMVGIYWQTTAAGDVLVVKPMSEVERHICLECIEAIQRIKLPVSGEAK